MASELILEKLLLKLLYRVQSAFINEQTILTVYLCNFNMFFLFNDFDFPVLQGFSPSHGIFVESR
jgi:hypothetical protein